MNIVYHYKKKILTEETAASERKQRYFYRNFKLYVVKYSEVAGDTQKVYLAKIGG